MSSTISRKKLLKLLSEHRRLLKHILRPQRLLRGSFHEVYTRCGKANCWCAKAHKGHVHARLTWSEEGTMITRKVGVKERKTVAKLTGNYRQFAQQRRRLTALQLQIQQHLDQYEKALITENRKPLGLLPTPAPMSAKTQSPLQTRRAKRNQL
jgi:hypothetical protein